MPVCWKTNSIVAASTDYKKNLNFRQRMHRKEKDQRLS